MAHLFRALSGLLLVATTLPARVLKLLVVAGDILPREGHRP